MIGKMLMNKRFLLMISGIILVAACSKNVETDAVKSNDGKLSQSKPSTLSVEMLTVPAGKFIMGSNKLDKEGLKDRYGFPEPLYLNEHPEREETLPAFKMDKYEVSNAQYKAFLIAAKGVDRGAVPPAWGQNGYGLAHSQMKTMELDTLRMIAAEHFKLDMDTRSMERDALITAMLEQQKVVDQFPVVGVTWSDAVKFCRWRNARLPTEKEWEKAARGEKGNEFPWGNKWDPKLTNTGDDAEWEEGIAPVGAYADNASVYGIYDLSGNVWEWVADWYQAIPGSAYKDPEYGEKHKVIKGGSGGMGHYAISYFYRNATRQYAEPNTVAEDIGFRCVTSL